MKNDNAEPEFTPVMIITPATPLASPTQMAAYDQLQSLAKMRPGDELRMLAILADTYPVIARETKKIWVPVGVVEFRAIEQALGLTGVVDGGELKLIVSLGDTEVEFFHHGPCDAF